MVGFELKGTKEEFSEQGTENGSGSKEEANTSDRTWRNWMLGAVGFLHFAGFFMGIFVIRQYVYRRIQIDTYPNVTFTTGISYCVNSPNVSRKALLRQSHVQEIAAGYNLVYNIASCVPSIAVNIIFGSYTDRFGRKFLLITSMTGTLLRTLICLLGVYTTMDLALFNIAFGVEGMSGQVFSWLLAGQAYISDITSKKKRAIGIVLNEVCVGLGLSASSFTGGYLLQAYGFKSPLWVSTSLIVVAIVITVFILPESYPKSKRRVSSNRCKNQRQAFEFYYAAWNKGLRFKYITAIVIFFFTMVTVLGRPGVELLYLLNGPFCWTPQKMGFFNTVRASLHQVVGMISIVLLKLFLEDTSIAMIGSVSFAAGYVLEGLATNGLMIYIGMFYFLKKDSSILVTFHVI